MATHNPEKLHEKLNRLREDERALYEELDRRDLPQEDYAWLERNLRAVGQAIADAEEAEAEEYERLSRIISVRFSIDGGTTKGKILQDAPGKSRTKIVFIARSWRGPTPTHGTEVQVRVVHETKPEDPRSGALFVEPIDR